MKTAKQLERHFKGAANHYRILILKQVYAQQGMTVDDLAKSLSANFKTISQHTKALVQAGLLNKRYQGRSVLHSLSPYGKRFIQFIKDFEKLGSPVS